MRKERSEIRIVRCHEIGFLIWETECSDIRRPVAAFATLPEVIEYINREWGE